MTHPCTCWTRVTGHSGHCCMDSTTGDICECGHVQEGLIIAAQTKGVTP